MKSTLWISFKLSDLFDFDSSGQLSLNRKNLDVSDTCVGDYTIALVTQSEKNNGVSGYLQEDDEILSKIKKNCLSYSMHFGLCFYHDYNFIFMDTHGSLFILKPKNPYLKTVLDTSKTANIFFAHLITHVCHNNIYNYSWLPNSSRVGREIILLPCAEVNGNGDYLVEKKGEKFYGLDLDYIQFLMESAKTIKKKRTFDVRYQKREELATKRNIYENAYLIEKPNVLWVPFRVGDLVKRSTKLAFKQNLKDLDLAGHFDKTHQISIVSASRDDKGVVGYISEDLVDSSIISINKMTFDDQWGFTSFHSEPFVITGGHNSVLEIENQHIKNAAKSNCYVIPFINDLINKVAFKSHIFSYNYKINNKLDREIVLLPCTCKNNVSDCLFEKKGCCYCLAINYISYIYLSGKIEYYDKLLNNYKDGY